MPKTPFRTPASNSSAPTPARRASTPCATSCSVKHAAWARSRRTGGGAAVELSATDCLGGEQPRISVHCERPGPAELTARREESAAAFAALDGLKRDERTALLLLAFGYSYREIAARQGWTRTKVNRCLAEGRQALREA